MTSLLHEQHSIRKSRIFYRYSSNSFCFSPSTHLPATYSTKRLKDFKTNIPQTVAQTHSPASSSLLLPSDAPAEAVDACWKGHRSPVGAPSQRCPSQQTAGRCPLAADWSPSRTRMLQKVPVSQRRENGNTVLLVSTTGYRERILLQEAEIKTRVLGRTKKKHREINPNKSPLR